jgi:hypothetical protein
VRLSVAGSIRVKSAIEGGIRKIKARLKAARARTRSTSATCLSGPASATIQQANAETASGPNLALGPSFQRAKPPSTGEACSGHAAVRARSAPENAGDGARPIPPSLSRRYLNQQQRFTYMFTQPLQLPQLSNEQGGRLGDGRDPPLKSYHLKTRLNK